MKLKHLFLITMSVSLSNAVRSGYLGLDNPESCRHVESESQSSSSDNAVLKQVELQEKEESEAYLLKIQAEKQKCYQNVLDAREDRDKIESELSTQEPIQKFSFTDVEEVAQSIQDLVQQSREKVKELTEEQVSKLKPKPKLRALKLRKRLIEAKQEELLAQTSKQIQLSAELYDHKKKVKERQEAINKKINYVQEELKHVPEILLDKKAQLKTEKAAYESYLLQVQSYLLQVQEASLLLDQAAVDAQEAREVLNLKLIIQEQVQLVPKVSELTKSIEEAVTKSREEVKEFTEQERAELTLQEIEARKMLIVAKLKEIEEPTKESIRLLPAISSQQEKLEARKYEINNELTESSNSDRLIHEELQCIKLLSQIEKAPLLNQQVIEGRKERVRLELELIPYAQRHQELLLQAVPELNELLKDLVEQSRQEVKELTQEELSKLTLEELAARKMLIVSTISKLSGPINISNFKILDEISNHKFHYQNEQDSINQELKELKELKEELKHLPGYYEERKANLEQQKVVYDELLSQIDDSSMLLYQHKNEASTETKRISSALKLILLPQRHQDQILQALPELNKLLQEVLQESIQLEDEVFTDEEVLKLTLTELEARKKLVASTMGKLEYPINIVSQLQILDYIKYHKIHYQKEQDSINQELKELQEERKHLPGYDLTYDERKANLEKQKGVYDELLSRIEEESVLLVQQTKEATQERHRMVSALAFIKRHQVKLSTTRSQDKAIKKNVYRNPNVTAFIIPEVKIKQ